MKPSAILVSPFFAAAVLCAAPAPGVAAAAPARPYTAEALAGRIVGPVAPGSILKVHVLLRGTHEDELDALIRLQATPGSPAYGRYLTPQEFGRYFGEDAANYARAIGMLRAAGFKIVDLANNRRDIVAQAPASAAEAFFQTPIDVHAGEGRTFYAARYAPVIPAGLDAVTITGLDNYHQMHSHVRVRPGFVHGGYFSWSPQDVAVYYDLNPLYAANLNGKGINIANATSGAASPTDLKNFEAAFKLPASYLSMKSIPIDGPLSYDPYYNGESTLDVDWATATARNANFTQVVAHSTANNEFDDVYKYIVDTLGATTHVVTTSWGTCEHDSSTSEMNLDDGYFKQAVSEGQWWFSAAGDNGTDDCEDKVTKTQSIDYPGASPYVISVGGTNAIATIANNNITGYKTERAWAYGACVPPYNGAGSNGAGGGGRSIRYSKPSYQQALTPADGRRDVPDVSLLSDDINDGLWVYQGGLYNGNGGTSEAAPQWAGLMAIVEQRKANFHNVIDPHVRLYQLAASANRASYFHDVIGGNNGVPACAKDKAGVFAGFSAVARYDLASGIGSYIGAALVNAY